MRRTCRSASIVALFVSLVLSSLWACQSQSMQRRASALEYLYPKGAPAQPPTDVALSLPLRVGIAFAPSAYPDQTFDESKKRKLLEDIARSFRTRPEIERVEIVPTFDMTPQGGFDNLDKIAARDGLETMALLSFEQVQFDEMKKSSITYWTVVGAYVIKGNRNETRTVVDASVFDIRSRALLFRASGTSSVTGSSTVVDASTELRRASAEGFDKATQELIASLNQSLEVFREQAKAGTVRGAGTPAISITAEAGYAGGGGGGGGGGAGALGAIEMLAVLLLVAAGLGSAALRGGARRA